MLTPIYTTKFSKDIKRLQKQRKDLTKLKIVVDALISESPLSAKFKDHPLKGEYVYCRECHIEPDWLLIYLIKEKCITFVRTGTHSELF